MNDGYAEFDVSWISTLLNTLLDVLFLQPISIVYNLLPVVGDTPVSMETAVIFALFGGFVVFYKTQME